jgi:2,4-dienoyl-CoA reductase (NADPH2)
VAGADFVEGGNTLEDTKTVAPIIEKAGVHAINVTTGWEEAPVPFIQMSVPRGSWIYLAESIKKVVNIPVIGGTRIPDPRLAEQILVEGRVDLVYVGRPLIADPEWLNKAREGRFDEIRPCIACCLCADGMTEGRRVQCSVNARAGQEAERSIRSAEQSKKVLVIGGGPASMEAARVACVRGHEVMLADERDQLGGQLLVAALPPHKEELGNLTRYLAGEIGRLGVRVRLGEEVTIKTVEDVNPDVVIVATGAMPIIPDIRGARSKNVATAIDVLTGRRHVGGNVVVIGGGMVGCETAEFLAEQGKKVTILEMLGRIGADIGPATRWVLMGRLRRLGVKMETNTKVEEITDTGVKATRNNGTEFFEADSIILAVGMKANRRLAEELEGKASAIYIIGDSETPGKITEAIERAFLVACEI